MEKLSQEEVDEFRDSLGALVPKPEAILVSEALFTALNERQMLSGIVTPSSQTGKSGNWKHAHLEFEGVVVGCDPIHLGHADQAHWKVHQTP